MVTEIARNKGAGGDHHNHFVLADQLLVSAVIAADIDPLQTVCRPDATPASVVAVVGVVVRQPNESKTMEAMMDVVVGVVMMVGEVVRAEV